MEKRTYLFVSDSDFSSGNLFGAHRRFLELAKGFSENANVIIVSGKIPQVKEKNILVHEINKKERKLLPSHISGMISVVKKLKEIRTNIRYDYAISFSPAMTLCYIFAGYTHIISLFREDTISYRKAVGASKISISYFRMLEVVAVGGSEKIIVQCKNDKENLIARTKLFCRNVSEKIYIQINNVNASWMKSEFVPIESKQDETTRILFIGNFSDSRKGHGILFPAIAKLLDENKKIELYIAGDGKEYEQYVQQYKKYPQMVFLGRVVDMEPYLSICDFEIVPSLVDSCPNTVLEGISAGIAVYGTNTGGIPDLLIEEKYMFQPCSDAIYEFLKEIIHTKRFYADAMEQRYLKDKLTFDWVKKIESCICDL